MGFPGNPSVASWIRPSAADSAESLAASPAAVACTRVSTSWADSTLGAATPMTTVSTIKTASAVTATYDAVILAWSPHRLFIAANGRPAGSLTPPSGGGWPLLRRWGAGSLSAAMWMGAPSASVP